MGENGGQLVHGSLPPSNSVPLYIMEGTGVLPHCTVVSYPDPSHHENRARVSRPFPPRTGDAIHPALQKREGSGTRLHAGDAIHPVLREWEGSGYETNYTVLVNQHYTLN
jgi:hypothetical protein